MSPSLFGRCRNARRVDPQRAAADARRAPAPSRAEPPFAATGAGHHSVLHVPGADRWFIVYHRRPLGEINGNHRVTCIDEMYFDEKGFIKPVKLTFEGVEKLKLK